MKKNSIKKVVIFMVIAGFSLVLFSCKKDNDNIITPTIPGVSVLSSAGDSAAIIGTVNQFRQLLGDPLNTTPGVTGGRREVNWDGVPKTLTNANNFPFDFFNSTLATDPAGRKRGIVLTNTGTSFRVDTTDFSEIDPSYAVQFEVFSRKRLFVYMGNTVTGVTFKLPGTTTDASIKGFGVIFSDVDDANSTYMEFFSGGTSLGTFKVPVHPATGNFSFLGVHFANSKVTSVKITSGNGLLATGVKDVSDGGSKDLVVMDDFFYDEPVSIN